MLVSLRIFLIVALALPSMALAAPPTSEAVLNEAQALIGKLTTRTERSAALFTLAQAQNRLGDRAGADRSLHLGWKAFETGTDQGLSEGDALDSFRLLDIGDFDLLPINYAYEFVVAGDIVSAKRAAMFPGETDLADAYRRGLADRLRQHYPDAVEEVAFTEAQRQRRAAQRKLLLASVAGVRAQADVTLRVEKLYEIADDLSRTNGRTEALSLFREAAAFAPQILDTKWRAIFEAQIADRLWRLDAKADAQALIVKADKEARGIPDEGKRLDARASVEQAKQTLGLPNDAGAVQHAIDVRNGTVPLPGGQAPMPGIHSPAADPNSNSALVMTAQELHAKGSDEEARRILRRLKPQQDDTDGWLVLAGEMQTQLGDKSAAQQNLREGSLRFVARLQPTQNSPVEMMAYLERIAKAQVTAGDPLGASKTLRQGVARLAQGIRWVKIMHLGTGGEHLIRHDRQSALLHQGAEALSRVGDYVVAIEMAHQIQSTAHRAIALAGIVRDNLTPVP